MRRKLIPTLAAPGQGEMRVRYSGGGASRPSRVQATKCAKQLAVLRGPTGATARCKDGTYSHAAHHQGACSHHGGVAQWMKWHASCVASVSLRAHRAARRAEFLARVRSLRRRTEAHRCIVRARSVEVVASVTAAAPSVECLLVHQLRLDACTTTGCAASPSGAFLKGPSAFWGLHAGGGSRGSSSASKHRVRGGFSGRRNY